MVVVPLRLQRGVVVARSSVEESPGSSEAFDGTLAQSDGVTLALFRKLQERHPSKELVTSGQFCSDSY